KKGSKLDVTVSSMGDASSLEGGTLLMTPLQDVQGEIYAMAQGALSVGGYSVGKVKSTMRKKNHTLSGQITGGAIVKQEVISNIITAENLRLTLISPDFTSAVEVAKAINSSVGAGSAKALDASTVVITVPKNAASDLMPFISTVENLRFEPSRTAKVVINEKTGTIVAGSDVTIDAVAVSHGAITVSVQEKTEVAQPNSFSMGKTEKVSNDSLKVEEEKPEVVVLPKTTNVGDLAKALNGIGASPRDIMAIFQAIKQAGGLNAELVVM
ncbi:MAG: flagellar basal body P-ring protein FlgI, partial [Fibrobacteres bacterium]|nr:flagellar basal body P-ring protein FlgI [Fibrobacterota bacterium]